MVKIEVIPILDSLAHPTLTGHWLDKDVDASFASLVTQLKRADFAGACAIGMADIEGYAHEPFMQQCKKYDCLVPIAGINPYMHMPLVEELDLITDLGFPGVKIHPRFSGFTQKLDHLHEMFQGAGARNLVVFYCTYMHCAISDYPEVDPIYSLISLLKASPSTKVILVHGGDVNLMRYAELVRFNDRLLLDLSLTMMKYQGSSVDSDLGYLFREFDRRICIGTDHPEYSHHEVRERFDMLSKGVKQEKLENIAYRNLQCFIGLPS